jgi:uncharacterized protein YdeI (YjbR/CyaY-like superfamily)
MTVPHADRERVHVTGRPEWRQWLVDHHATSTGVWLVSWKRATGRPAVPYDEAVEEALCFGWVDSKAGTLDAERSLLWFCPRRRGSGWSRSNKERIARLEAQGLMAPAGRALVESAKADGTWTLLDDVENLVVPDDLAAAFEARPGSRARWDAFPRSVRRANLEWIALAKRAPTRTRRVEETAGRAARGERANQWEKPPGPGPAAP